MPFNIDNWKMSGDQAREYVRDGAAIQQADQEKNLEIVTDR